jgi:hypothetical protein
MSLQPPPGVDLAASNQIAVVLHDLGDDDGNNHDGDRRAHGASDHRGDDDEELPPTPPELHVEVVDEGQSCFAMQPATVISIDFDRALDEAA